MLAPMTSFAYPPSLREPSFGERLSPGLEAEFIRSRIRDRQALIRAACCVGVILPLLRAIEQTFRAKWSPGLLWQVALIVGISVALATLAFSRGFERRYVPIASVLLPMRGSLAAMLIANAAAHGYYEPLMVLPLMMVSPFFFFELPLRPATVCMAVTVCSFIGTAVIQN